MEIKRRKITVTVSNDLVTDQRMARICTTLAESGYEVDLVGRKLNKSLSIVENSYKQNRLNLWFTTGPIFYLELNIRLLIYLLLTKPSVIYVVDADTALAGMFAKKILQAKLIYDAHELFSEVTELQGRNWIKKIWKWIEKHVIYHSDIRITVTESIANYFEKLYGFKFEVIYNYSNPRLNVYEQPTEKYILYQGALNKGRGLGELIKASSSFDIKLKIAGDGDLTHHLIKLAESNPRIEFVGKLIPSELEKLTANAWLGYNLLENNCLSYCYSLSNKTFDYMQAGVPQLIPDLLEYVKLNSKWSIGMVIPLNSMSISKAVIDLQTQTELYASLRENALSASKKMLWSNESQKLQNLMLELR